jgi:hypothetical protein
LEYKKILQKSTLAFKGGWNSENHEIWWFLSFTLSFFFPFFLSGSIAATFLTAPTCTGTIIPLEPYALNAEIQHFRTEFQHFILRFNKNLLTLWIPLKEGLRGERRPKDRVKTGWL